MVEKVPFPTFEAWLQAMSDERRAKLVAGGDGPARNRYYTEWGQAIHSANQYPWVKNDR